MRTQAKCHLVPLHMKEERHLSGNSHRNNLDAQIELQVKKEKCVF